MDSEARRTQSDIARYLQKIAENIEKQNLLLEKVVAALKER
jgi:hypothetical protein